MKEHVENDSLLEDDSLHFRKSNKGLDHIQYFVEPSPWAQDDHSYSTMDTVNHPLHYAGDIECIDAMFQQFGVEKVKSFCLLNAFKYLWRCDKKYDNNVEDVKKAMWYLNKYLELCK